MVPDRVTVVTLGARDLARLKGFYAGLGWELAVDLDDFAAFATRGIVLCLYPLELLAEDAAAEPAAPERGLRGFALALNQASAAEVDSAMEAAQAAGARIAKPPERAEWGGYSGYFADPEDNFWEVAHVPGDSNVARLIERARG